MVVLRTTGVGMEGHIVSMCLGRYCTSAAYIKQINIVQGACGQLLIVDGHIL